MSLRAIAWQSHAIQDEHASCTPFYSSCTVRDYFVARLTPPALRLNDTGGLVMPARIIRLFAFVLHRYRCIHHNPSAYQYSRPVLARRYG